MAHYPRAPWKLDLPEVGHDVRTCVVGVFTPGLALDAAALLHTSLAHTGPVVAHLKILVACFIKAFLCESHSAATASREVPSPRQAPPTPGWTQQLL